MRPETLGRESSWAEMTENEILIRLVNKHGWPTCARCQKPVEELVVETDGGFPRRMLTVVARCHGAFEAVEIPENMRDETFSLAGEAFVERKELLRNEVQVSASGKNLTVLSPKLNHP